MSTTQRYGTIVWDALWAICAHYSDNPRHFASVGEVAVQARVSSATAKKYLEIMAGTPDVVSVGIANHKGYRPSVLMELE